MPESDFLKKKSCSGDFLPKRSKMSSKSGFSSLMKNKCLQFRFFCMKLLQHKVLKIELIVCYGEHVVLKFLAKRLEIDLNDFFEKHLDLRLQGQREPKMRFFKFYRNLVQA